MTAHSIGTGRMTYSSMVMTASTVVTENGALKLPTIIQRKRIHHIAMETYLILLWKMQLLIAITTIVNMQPTTRRHPKNNCAIIIFCKRMCDCYYYKIHLHLHQTSTKHQYIRISTLACELSTCTLQAIIHTIESLTRWSVCMFQLVEISMAT